MRRRRESQILPISYLRNHQHVALFMEMRLGKTLCAIRQCLQYPPRCAQAGLRVLVVCPSSCFKSWVDELELENERDYQILIGTRQQRLDMIASLKRWNIINKEGHIAIPEIANPKWDAVILDESIFVKNPKAKVTKFFLRNFREVPHRWILTGKPNPESDLEFWCQLAFLDGCAFGSYTYWDFRTKYFEPAYMGYKWTHKLGAPTAIRKYVARRAFVLRRKDVSNDVAKVYETRTIQMPRKIRKIYRTIVREFILETDTSVKTTKWAMQKFIWLRKLCGGFADKDFIWDGKLSELLLILQTELAGENVVVWFDYNCELFETQRVLAANKIKCNMLYGKIDIKKRMQVLQDFGKTFNVLLLQQAVSQTGVNLSASDTSIYYSTPLGCNAREQTEDRIVALNKQSVLIIDLVVENSIDEKLIDLVKQKKFEGSWTLQRIRKLMVECHGEKTK